MVTNTLPITNVINITIENTPSGLAIPNVNNLLLLTTEVPTNLEVFGNYLSAAQVAANYGTLSVTTAMANEIFSQAPNPLSGTGQLVIAPFSPASVAVSATSGKFVSANISANVAALIAITSGNWKVTVNGVAQNLANLNFTQCTTLAQIAAVLQAALIDCVVTATSTVLTITANKVGSTSTIAVATYAGGGTDLNGASYFNGAGGTATGGANSSGETIATAIARILPQQFFAGVITNLNIEDAAITAAATAVQAQDMLFLHHCATSTDIAGIITTIQQATDQKTRLLPYLTGGQAVANLYKAAYAGRLYSQDFTGSNTSFTMHMKQLVGVLPDQGITQTLLNACVIAGGDPYVSIMGYPMVFSTGGNDYADNQYSNLALKFALEIAGFNYLAQTNTKVPQTEPGMNGLKAAYIGICQQFVTNGELAAGTWGSSETFGDPVTFLNNILQNGYYVYSAPVALQSQAARIARTAPLVQIALKRAGAIHSSNVIVIINS